MPYASRTSNVDTADALVNSIQRFELVNGRLKEAEEDAKGFRVDAAELASRATVLMAECVSAAQLVKDEQRNTYTAMENAERGIHSAQQESLENAALSRSMETSANHHGQEIDNYGQVSS